MLGFVFLIRAPLGTERLLHEIQQEVRKDEPVFRPIKCSADSHEPITLVHKGDDRMTVALLLLAHVFLCLVQAHHFLGLPHDFRRHGPHAGAHIWLELVNTTLFVFLAALARARFIPADFACRHRKPNSAIKDGRAARSRSRWLSGHISILSDEFD